MSQIFYKAYFNITAGQRPDYNIGVPDTNIIRDFWLRATLGYLRLKVYVLSLI